MLFLFNVLQYSYPHVRHNQRLFDSSQSPQCASAVVCVKRDGVNMKSTQNSLQQEHGDVLMMLM